MELQTKVALLRFLLVSEVFMAISTELVQAPAFGHLLGQVVTVVEITIDIYGILRKFSAIIWTLELECRFAV